MRGTWQTADGGGAPVLAGIAVIAAVGALEWFAARIWWVLGGTAVLGALAVAAVLWLIRWSDRRAAAVFAARRPAPRDGADFGAWEKELKD